MSASNYKVWGWGGPIGLGVTQSVHVGIAGIAKANSQHLPRTVCNEFICSELGRAIRLPVPPGVIVRKENTPFFVSLNFNETGQQLPPADPVALVQAHPDLACGIVLFDAWVLNHDRHRGNLSYNKASQAVTVFDHSHALSMHSIGGAEAKKDELLIGNHCLAGEIESIEHFKKWSGRIADVPGYVISEVLAEAVDYGLPPEEASRWEEILKHRQKALMRILEKNAGVFRKVKADLWSVQPAGNAVGNGDQGGDGSHLTGRGVA